MPFSMESNVRPPKRSGVWTMCPAWRSSSANTATPRVSPCAWWNNTTSAIFEYPFCNWLQYLALNGSRPAPYVLHGVPAGGREEATPLCQNQLQATQTAQKRADSHHLPRRKLPGFGARCVGRLAYEKCAYVWKVQFEISWLAVAFNVFCSFKNTSHKFFVMQNLLDGILTFWRIINLIKNASVCVKNYIRY